MSALESYSVISSTWEQQSQLFWARSSGRHRRLVCMALVPSLHLHCPGTSATLQNEWEQDSFCNNQTMLIDKKDFRKSRLALLSKADQFMKGLSSVWSSVFQDTSEYLNTITLDHQRNEVVMAIKHVVHSLFQQMTHFLSVSILSCHSTSALPGN